MQTPTRVRKQKPCKLSPTKRPAPAKVKMTPAEKQKLRRQRVKENPDAYEEYKIHEASRSRVQRQTMSDEQKAHYREQAKLRIKKFRERKKELQEAETPRRHTRLTERQLEQKKERNRESQKKRRENMTGQKRRRENEKARRYYHQLKVLKSEIQQKACQQQQQQQQQEEALQQQQQQQQQQEEALQQQQQQQQQQEEALQQQQQQQQQQEEALQQQQQQQQQQEEALQQQQQQQQEEALQQQQQGEAHQQQENFASLGARRLAAFRLKKVLSKSKNYLGTLVALVRASSHKQREQLKKLGVTYSSPKNRVPSPTLSPNHPFSSLKKKRDLTSLKCKRTLFGRSADALYQRRKMHKGGMLARTYISNSATHLPGVRSVYRRTGQPRQILDRSLRQLHQAYLSENPDCRVGFSTFCKKRPKNIVGFTKMPLLQCRCELCDNPMAKAKAINKFLAADDKLETHIDALVGMTLCAADGFARPTCVDRKCLKCGVHLLRDHLQKSIVNQSDFMVTWIQLEKVAQKLDKVEKITSLTTAVDLLCQEMESVARHRFNARWQTTQYQQLTSSVPEGTAVLTLDFSENYRCEHQDQAQSMYYAYSQVTVHPVVMHYRCPTCNDKMIDNAVFLTDELDHSAHFVKQVTEKAIEYLQQKIPLKKIFIFSDGCASQYKSKLPFHYLQQHPKTPEVERCYFGSRHGKSLCDALGGVVKTAARREVKARAAVIRNATDLHNFCQQKLAIVPQDCNHKSRWFYLVQKEEIVADITSAELKTLPGTRSLHSIRPTDSGLMSRTFSCFCAACFHGKWSDCPNLVYTGNWRMHGKVLSHQVEHSEHDAGD